MKIRGSRNLERIEYDALLHKLLKLLFCYRGMIRVTILKNIALVSHALLTLFSGARGSNGWLSKAALSRCLPLEIGPKEREQRLYRFLRNPLFTPEVLIPLHVALACGTKLRERLPMILDQMLIPLNSAIYSDGKRPLVPIETGHPLSERSDAGVMIFYTILKLSQV